MPLYWLCYRHDDQIAVVIEQAASLVHARMKAAIAGLDEGEFTEGHELPGKWKVPKAMIGLQPVRLSRFRSRKENFWIGGCLGAGVPRVHSSTGRK